MEYNRATMRSEDIEELELLDVQQLATTLSVIADLLSYKAVLESRELILNRYREEKFTVPNPDETVLQSISIYLIAKILFTNVGFMRYQYLSNEATEGEIEYSLEPNAYVNIGNIFGILGTFYLVNAAQGFVARDANLPIFGIR